MSSPGCQEPHNKLLNYINLTEQLKLKRSPSTYAHKHQLGCEIFFFSLKECFDGERPVKLSVLGKVFSSTKANKDKGRESLTAIKYFYYTSQLPNAIHPILFEYQAPEYLFEQYALPT